MNGHLMIQLSQKKTGLDSNRPDSKRFGFHNKSVTTDFKKLINCVLTKLFILLIKNISIYLLIGYLPLPKLP